MNVKSIITKATRAASDNSPLLLTAIGVAGTLTTAYLTHKAALQADRVLSTEVYTASEEHNATIPKSEIIKAVWTLYIPPVTSATLTCAAIIGANRVGTRRAAAMAAAYTISERAYDEYKAKVVEKLGEKKEIEIRDSIAQDRVRRTSENREVIITTSGGNVLCMDGWSGRYFQCDMETLRKAQNDINQQILHADSATVDDYYEIIGLESTDASPQFGWNTNKPLELEFSTTLVDEKTPCLVVNFASMPMSEPWRFC